MTFLASRSGSQQGIAKCLADIVPDPFVILKQGLHLRGITSDSVILGIMPHRSYPNVCGPGQPLLPFIRSTICPEANSNVKREMAIFGGPL